MCGDIFSILKMGCCGCFGFMKKTQRSLVSVRAPGAHLSQEFLLPVEYSDNDSFFMFEGEGESFINEGFHGNRKNFDEILQSRIKNGMTSRRVPVRETRQVVRSEDENGTKMINEYVRECKIGSGSYGKVVLHRSTKDGKQYAIKVFHKSHLMKLRVAPSETAMSDVLREVAIMKILDHPNVVKLVEVIDDPTSDHFYMVLEYVEGKWSCDGCGPHGGLGEETSKRYLKDIVAGLIYLHSNNIIHGDIKPDNLLVTSGGRVKIGDFSVSQVFEDDDDELRRSPGTPVFTAPECCQGLTYQGKVADTWAVGVTLYCMIFGQYPFLGETLQDTYDKIVNDPLFIPDEINPQLKNLLEGLLCKDPRERLTLQAVAEHPWVLGEDGPNKGPSHEAEAAQL